MHKKDKNHLFIIGSETHLFYIEPEAYHLKQKLNILYGLVAFFGFWSLSTTFAAENQPKKLQVIQEEVTQQFALKPGPRRGAPYPVLLVHGFMGFNRMGKLDYFFRVKEYLQSHGEEVYNATIPPFQGVEQRSEELAKIIDDILYETWSEKLHIIAHSQGGVDSRYVISALGYENKVASLITIATPHLGTPLADYVLKAPKGAFDPVSRTMGWIIGRLDTQEFDDENAKDGDSWEPRLDRSLQQLSLAGMNKFNKKHPDPIGFPIYSIAGVSSLQSADDICSKSRWGLLENIDILEPLLWATGTVLAESGPKGLKEPNDGVVTTRSMVWGDFLGCIAADHFDQVGQIADVGEHWVSGFEHLNFYYRLVTFIREQEKSS